MPWRSPASPLGFQLSRLGAVSEGAHKTVSPVVLIKHADPWASLQEAPVGLGRSGARASLVQEDRGRCHARAGVLPVSRAGTSVHGVLPCASLLGVTDVSEVRGPSPLKSAQSEGLKTPTIITAVTTATLPGCQGPWTESRTRRCDQLKLPQDPESGPPGSRLPSSVAGGAGGAPSRVATARIAARLRGQSVELPRKCTALM